MPPTQSTAIISLALYSSVLTVGIVVLGLKLKRRTAEWQRDRYERERMWVALDKAPVDILWLDENLIIERTNGSAERAAQQAGVQLVGMPHLSFDAEIPEDHLKAILQADSKSLACFQSAHLEHYSCGLCEDIICRYEAGGRKGLLRYGFKLVDLIYAMNVDKRCTTIQHEQVHETLLSAKRMRMEFITNMNHEIRTPMNAIIGYAEMLVASELRARERRFAKAIYKSGMTLVNLLNDIMDLSKIESGQLKLKETTVRLSAIVQEGIRAIENAARNKNLKLWLDIQDDVPELIVFDGERLKQILQILLKNAVKYTPKGHIAVLVEAQRSSTSHPEKWTLTITVEDTGRGMDRSQEMIVSEVLNPVSDKSLEVYSGIGFGIPLCARLTAMMGGRIHLQTEKGKGAVFTVTFNNVQSITPAATPIRKEQRTSPRRLSSTRILVVDDMDLIKDVFTDYFAETEFTVSTASTGEDALEKVKEEQPGLIFMDFNLVGKNGGEVAEELRADPVTEGIPIILMTGTTVGHSDYPALFDGFLQKPFRLEDIDRLVSTFKNRMDTEGERILVEPKLQASAETGIGLLTTLWNRELDSFLDLALHTGSLSVALALGNRILEIGEEEQSQAICRLGKALVEAAGEPDIVEVEGILTSLKAMSGLEK